MSASAARRPECLLDRDFLLGPAEAPDKRAPLVDVGDHQALGSAGVALSSGIGDHLVFVGPAASRQRPGSMQSVSSDCPRRDLTEKPDQPLVSQFEQLLVKGARWCDLGWTISEFGDPPFLLEMASISSRTTLAGQSASILTPPSSAVRASIMMGA